MHCSFRSILLIFIGLWVALSSQASDSLFPLNSQLWIDVVDGKQLELVVEVKEPTPWESIAARYTEGASRGPALAAWNPGQTNALGLIRIPFRMLSGPYRELVLRSAFPQDEIKNEHWIHVAKVSSLPLYDVGLWQIAEWFCGDGRAFEELSVANKLRSPELKENQKISIPPDCLDPALKPGPMDEEGVLSYGHDELGPYALYRMQSGEALYSAVVVRFTGRQAAEDVVDLATKIAARSGVTDLTDIPVHYPIKIPFKFLEPRYLPQDHPRRLAAEAEALAVANALAEDPVDQTRNGLDGVWVVIDAGHGGEDMGTMAHGLWEHDYVYDVVCRLKTELESKTNAQVFLTLYDNETGCTPSKGDKLRANQGGHLQTTPPYLQKKGQSKLGVNLRWYIANARYREALKQNINPERIIFLSIHADSRSPSLRGMMAYIPGASYRKGRAQPSGATYRKYQEVRSQPKVSISRSKALRSEALSKKLAQHLVRAFKEKGLPVPPANRQPIRNRIIRGRSVYVPAVLRWNETPTQLLVEVVNLNNKQDAVLLGKAKERQRMADAIFDGLFKHFGEIPPD